MLIYLWQPYAILMSIGSCWFFGFIIMIVIAACINPDLSSVIGSSYGQPMAQVSTPKDWSFQFMFSVQWLTRSDRNCRSTTTQWANTVLSA